MITSILLVLLYVRKQTLYEIGEKDVRGIDDARQSLFVKAKRDLDILSPTHGALDLHITRAKYLDRWLRMGLLPPPH